MDDIARPPFDKRLALLCALLSCVILSMDSLTPLGVADGVLYAVVVVISAGCRSRTFTMITAAVSTVLILLGILMHPDTHTFWIGLANRGLCVAVVWTIAFILVSYLRVERQRDAAIVELEVISLTDGLTGLWNRRAFETRLADELSRAHRYGLSLCLLMIDVDHFKPFNDHYGHPEGDLVLKQVAEVIAESSRENDFPARYGGEEFAVLLPHTDERGAAGVGERLRHAVELASWHSRPVTVSIGVSCLTSPPDGAESFVAQADAALYQAKESGRNRVVLYRVNGS